MSALCSSQRTLQRPRRSSRRVSGPAHCVQTAEKCKANGSDKVGTHSADLTSVQSRDKLVSRLLTDHSSIDILVNAAGVVGVLQISIAGSASNMFGGVVCWGFDVVRTLHLSHTLHSRHDAQVWRGSTSGCACRSSAVQAMCIGAGSAAWSINCGTLHV